MRGRWAASTPSGSERTTSCSYYAPGYCDQYSTYERVAARPFHFAGEHVSQDAQGYVEGGAYEGIRAAREIVADYV